jgi:hypothetical protein
MATKPRETTLTQKVKEVRLLDMQAMQKVKQLRLLEQTLMQRVVKHKH